MAVPALAKPWKDQILHFWSSHEVIQLELKLCCQGKLDSGWDVSLALLQEL